MNGALGGRGEGGPWGNLDSLTDLWVVAGWDGGGSSSSEPDNLRNDAKAPGPRTIFILNA